MADSLASKVTRLKSLALDIDRDAEDQNRYLDGMGSDFTSMTGLLTGSVKRFSTMARSGRDNRKLLCGQKRLFWKYSCFDMRMKRAVSGSFPSNRPRNVGSWLAPDSGEPLREATPQAINNFS
ncbi:BET1-like protein isoform X2 [Budorcas taxicolor]|nr:BET1-like protein isoform X2 [Budorcas taxicolor]